MTDAEIVEVLSRHVRGGGSRTHRRVARPSVEREIGDERLLEVDAWVGARGGTVERVIGRPPQPIRRRKLAASPSPIFEYYLVPWELLVQPPA